MSLAQALMKHKQELEDIKVSSKIEQMLKEQKERLAELTPIKTKESWDETILVNGGVSTFSYVKDGKRKNVKVSVCSVDNDTIYRYHFRKADGVRVSVNAKTYKDAQYVVDELFGKNMYKVSGSVV